MHFWKKIFRNPNIDFLFVLGLSVSCIVIISIAELLVKLNTESDSMNAYKYFDEVFLSLTYADEDENKENIKNVIDFCESFDKGNVYLTNNLSVDRQRVEGLAYVLMKNNEKLKFEYKWGGFSENINYSNAVIIGESLEKKITIKNKKKTIMLGDDEFNVIGILDNKLSGGVDYSIYVIWDTLDDIIKNDWKNGKWELCRIYYESDIEKRDINIVKDNVSSFGIGTTKKGKYYQNEWYKITNKFLLAIALFFSIISTFSVSYLWMIGREKEFAIRLAYGYSSDNIFFMLFKDIFKLVLFALIITVFIQGIKNMIIGDLDLFDKNFFSRITIVFGGMVGIVLLNTLYLMRKLRTFSATMLKEDN